MRTSAIIMAISVMALFLSIPISVSAEEQGPSPVVTRAYIMDIFNLNSDEHIDKEKHSTTYIQQNFGGQVEVTEQVSDSEDDENKKVEPAPHPALDLPINIGIFIFTTLTISFIVYVSKIRKTGLVKL